MEKKIAKQISKIHALREKIHRFLTPVISSDTLGQQSQNTISVRPQWSYAATEVRNLQELKVAGIMDEFTLECFRPECQLLELVPDTWKEQIDGFKPDLLFLESAWQGKDGLWHGKINHCTQEVIELTDYCRAKQIPIVFWNKEDPVYTDTFIKTARHADIVFTTELECIQKYKTELGHDQVYHLHFGAQPAVHNPIEKYDRKDRFCFAGAYYHRYQDRCRIFDAFSDYFIESKGFDIFDRNYQNARPEHKFPDRYDPYILGRLEPSEIDLAYKGYVFGINMNSITNSQTMFARRVFELMASNTLVVGNYSRGVKNYFGDLTICTDDEKTLRSTLAPYCADENLADKLRLLALRKVLEKHLCEDRLDYIVSKVFGRSMKRQLPSVCVVSSVQSQEEADRVLRMFQCQRYDRKELLLVGDVSVPSLEKVTVISAVDWNAAEISADYTAFFCVKDWYGEYYLTDLVLATRYGCFDMIGKAEYFAADSDGSASRLFCGTAYHTDCPIAARRGILRTVHLPDAIPDENTVWSAANSVSVDAMNYCCNWHEDSCPAAADLFLPDQGIDLEIIEKTAEKIQAKKPSEGTILVTPQSIAGMMIRKGDPLSVELQDRSVCILSHLPAQEHRYVNLPQLYDLESIASEGRVNVIFRAEGTLHTIGYCFFYDRQRKKISAQSCHLNRLTTVDIPEGGVYLQLAFRFKEAGTATIYNVELGRDIQQSTRGDCFLSRSNVLVLSNHYPAPDALYRNMFVHKRLTAYKDQGKIVDVFRMNPYTVNSVREFEGINVLDGQADMLGVALRSGSIDTVCVHFLDEDMWNVLKKYIRSVRILVWLHGAEIQPWWRREYNYETEEELKQAKKKSDVRMAFWHKVFDTSKETDNLHFVFVSQYFADEVLGDYQISLAKDKYSIVHNCIDTEQFTYIPKLPKDRKKILSIRPYASNKYANDLTVKAILELAKEPWFSELDIALYGSGPLFESILAPLDGLSNVYVEKTFFTQSEIAALHKQYGIFLTPTRMDAQGVSRDEAMSSGLVPVTNNVTAIPEFVDETCGILAPGEDYKAMAAGIARLYHDPELFLRMSENAAKRVRSQTSREYTIDKEIRIIFPQSNHPNASVDGVHGGTKNDGSS